MFYDFAAIKAAYSFADIIDQLGLEMKQSGNQWRGECPFCNSGGDRALVITEGKGYYCHSSKRGGDQLALYSHVRDISIKDAAAELAGNSKSTSTVPTSTSTSSQESRQPSSAAESAKPPASARASAGFDRSKYQATLDRKHELLKDIPADLCERADIGVSSKGALKGIVLPLYDIKIFAEMYAFCYEHGFTGDDPFICYAKVEGIQLPKATVTPLKKAS